ncbi:hypothetical protein ACHAPU_006726 [Fusarium lateritium]
MGNICGKTEPEAFSQPGRVLGSAPPPTAGTAPVPKKVGGPPRTLGGGSVPEASGDVDNARRRAAEAAEVRKNPPQNSNVPWSRDFDARAKATSKPGGKLQSQLAAQKKQTRSETLKDASQEQLRARESDQAAETRNWE